MSYKILAKYIKDLKFEIPNTETYFEFTKEIAKYKINIDIKSKEIKKKIIEVETCLHLKPHEKDTGKLKSNIVYNTIIQLDEEVKEKEGAFAREDRPVPKPPKSLLPKKAEFKGSRIGKSRDLNLARFHRQTPGVRAKFLSRCST